MTANRFKVCATLGLLSQVTSGTPALLCGEYFKQDKGWLVMTGKIRDVESGLALLVVEKK